jgi:hypothetical protein
VEDRIEHRITVRARLDRVWSQVTRPGWWLAGSRLEPARGVGRVAVEWGREQRPWVLDVIRVEPQGYVSFRWAGAFGGAAPSDGNSTLVEFYLRPAGEEVSVTVVESGFAALNLPQELREDQVAAAIGGWRYEMASLRMRAEHADAAQLASSGQLTRH